MLASDPVEFVAQAVQVETQTGEGAYGDTYAPAESVRCLVDYETQLVRNSDGAEVVSSGRLFTTLDKVGLFRPDSRITLPDGSKTYVLRVGRHELGDPDMDHLEVMLR